MKTSDLKQIDSKAPLCLIICEDEQEREEGVNAYSRTISVTLDPESFGKFGQEVETIPMHQHVVLFKRVDQLKNDQLDQIICYAKNPNKHIFVCLTAAQLTGNLVKAVEKEGVVYSIPKEKPWDRERRLADSFSHAAAKEGVVFPLDVSMDFVKAFGTDKTLLQTELEKLICYVCERKEITRADIKAVSVPLPRQTFWELADAIFARNFKMAYQVTCELLHEGVSIFPILSSLRTQAEMAQKILTLVAQGGQECIQKEYPYLKGRLYDKKIALYHGYGTFRLLQLQQALFKSELEARDSMHEPLFILEKLLTRIIPTQDLKFAQHKSFRT